MSDCIGRKFGRLTVLKLDRIAKNYQKIYLCKCDCGTIKPSDVVDLFLVQ